MNNLIGQWTLDVQSGDYSTFLFCCRLQTHGKRSGKMVMWVSMCVLLALERRVT